MLSNKNTSFFFSKFFGDSPPPSPGPQKVTKKNHLLQDELLSAGMPEAEVQPGDLKIICWSNYSDLTNRPGPRKGSSLEGKWDPENFSEIYRLVKY